MNEPLPNPVNAAAVDILDNNDNVVIGTGSLGTDNIIIGKDSCDAVTTATNNLVLGHESGQSITDGSNNILLGRQTALHSANPSSQLYIDSGAVANPLIGGDFGARTLNFNGELTLNVNSDPVLTANSIKLAGGALVPDSGDSIATKDYVDNYAQGLVVYEPVTYKTTTNLAATYDNGVDGTGATLTIANSGLTLDGFAFTAGLDEGKRVLVADQTDETHNGIYVVTQIGNVAANTVLTRSDDLNGSPDHEVKVGVYVNVLNGDLFVGTGWVLSTRQTLLANPPVISLDDGANEPLTWVMFRGAAVNLGGTLESLQAITYPPTDNLFITSAGGDWEATSAGTALSRLALNTSGVIEGDGTAATPIKLTDGGTAGDLLQWNGSAWANYQLPSIPLDLFDAKVGTGQDFSTVQAAFDAGHRSILVTSNTTEAANLTLTASVYIYIAKNVTLTIDQIILEWTSAMVDIYVVGESNVSSQITLTDNFIAINNPVSAVISATSMSNVKFFNLWFNTTNNPSSNLLTASHQNLLFKYCILNRESITAQLTITHGTFEDCIFYRCRANSSFGTNTARLLFSRCSLLNCWLYVTTVDSVDSTNGNCPARFDASEVTNLNLLCGIQYPKLVLLSQSIMTNLVLIPIVTVTRIHLYMDASTFSGFRDKFAGTSTELRFNENITNSTITNINRRNSTINFATGPNFCNISDILCSTLIFGSATSNCNITNLNIGGMQIANYNNNNFSNIHVNGSITHTLTVGGRSSFTNINTYFNMQTVAGGSDNTYNNLRGYFAWVNNSVACNNAKFVNCQFTIGCSVSTTVAANTNYWYFSNCVFESTMTVTNGQNIFFENCKFTGAMTLSGTVSLTNVHFNNCVFLSATNNWTGTITNLYARNCRGTTNIANFGTTANLAVVDAYGND